MASYLIVVVDDDESAEEMIDTIEREYRARGCEPVSRGDTLTPILVLGDLKEAYGLPRVILVGDNVTSEYIR